MTMVNQDGVKDVPAGTDPMHCGPGGRVCFLITGAGSPNRVLRSKTPLRLLALLAFTLPGCQPIEQPCREVTCNDDEVCVNGQCLGSALRAICRSANSRCLELCESGPNCEPPCESCIEACSVVDVMCRNDPCIDVTCADGLVCIDGECLNATLAQLCSYGHRKCLVTCEIGPVCGSHCEACKTACDAAQNLCDTEPENSLCVEVDCPIGTLCIAGECRGVTAIPELCASAHDTCVATCESGPNCESICVRRDAKRM